MQTRNKKTTGKKESQKQDNGGIRKEKTGAWRLLLYGNTDVAVFADFNCRVAFESVCVGNLVTFF